MAKYIIKKGKAKKEPKERREKRQQKKAGTER